ncbi:MAG: hypothetical protein AAF204_04470 [Pseudomonadota bacterium]
MKQSKRYETPQGDPIHGNRILNACMADDVKVMGISGIFVAAAHNFTFNSAEGLNQSLYLHFEHSVLDVLINRLLFEKVALNRFSDDGFLLGSSESLREFCVDKFPEPEDVINSHNKHGEKIHNARFYYALLLATDLLVTLATSIGQMVKGSPDGYINYIAVRSVDITRMFQGFRRFNKLAKGQWAIVDTPPPEKVTKKEDIDDLAYTPV